MKKLLYLFLVLLITSCGDEVKNDNFNPGKPPVEIEQPEKPIDTSKVEDPEVKPVLTQKEITETQSIPFPTEKTSLEVKVREGEEGVLSITYLVTLKNGKEIERKKLRERVTKNPRSRREYVKPEPVITYEEVSETESIPFTYSVTNIQSEGRSGEEGILTITYKLTFKDGEQIAKEKISEVITKQPRSEISYEEPEPNPQENIYDITLVEGEDNTNRLQEQLDDIPNGTKDSWVTVNFPKGSYNVEGNNLSRLKQYATQIDSKEYWIVNAYGTEIFVKKPSIPFGGNINAGKYSHRRQLRINNSDNIIINGLTLTGANFLDGGEYGISPETPEWWESDEPDNSAGVGSGAYVSYWEFEHNFNSENSTNITFKDCVGKNPFGDAFYIHKGSNVKIIDSRAEHVGRQLIATSSVSDLLIDNFYGVGGRRTGIDLETDYAEQVISNIEIKNSYIECKFGFVTAGGPGAVNNVWIHGNKFKAGGNTVYCRSNGLRVRRENWTYENNERIGRFGSTAPALKFGYTDNVIIRNNIDASDRYFVGNSMFTNMQIYDNEVSKGYVVRVGDFEEGTLVVEDEAEILDNTELIPLENRIYKN